MSDKKPTKNDGRRDVPDTLSLHKSLLVSKGRGLSYLPSVVRFPLAFI